MTCTARVASQRSSGRRLFNCHAANPPRALSRFFSFSCVYERSQRDTDCRRKVLVVRSLLHAIMSDVHCHTASTSQAGETGETGAKKVLSFLQFLLRE